MNISKMNNAINKSIKTNFVYKYIKNDQISIFILFIVICLLYYKYKITGFIVSLIACILIPFYFLNNKWEITTILKILFIVFPSLIFFSKINFESSININWLITSILAINVFILLFVLVPNTTINLSHKFLLAFGILLITLGTPFISIKKNIVSMKKLLLNVNGYVILSTIILSLYYLIYPEFKEDVYFVIFSLILPLISHFINNKWLETRALLLCLFIIFDFFDIANCGFLNC
tara:strand:- start:2638 stop:3339 length:702 start_codon:yes stop_codon:yes gene_type:complete